MGRANNRLELRVADLEDERQVLTEQLKSMMEQKARDADQPQSEKGSKREQNPNGNGDI